MVINPARRPIRGATKAVAAARASESAPPEQATRTSASFRIPCRMRRTATRVAATGGAGPATSVPSALRQQWSGASAGAVYAGHPGVRVAQFLEPGQGQRGAEDLVEAGHADAFDDAVHELAALGVLPHLHVDAEQLADRLLQGVAGLAPAVEPGPDLLDAGYHLGADAVHHELRVALQQGHQRGEAVEHGPLAGRLHYVEHAGPAVRVAQRVGEGRDGAAHPFDEVLAAALGGVDERLDLAEEVGAHPGHRGELGAVGDLVEADPEAEVAGVGAELALDLDGGWRHGVARAGGGR